MNRTGQRILIGASIGAVLVASVVVVYKPFSGTLHPNISEVAARKEVAVDAEHRLQIDLMASVIPDFALGELTLGSIHVLRIAVGNDAAVRSVASSCSCLQVLSVPSASADPQSSDKADDAAITIRYFAVRTGPVDVALAFSRLDPEGKEQIQTLRLTGSVGPGDTARAAALDTLLKTPLLIPPQKDLSGVVPAIAAVESVRAGRGMLVDLRPEEEFTPHHATQAIHIPVAQLTANGFFAGREVYLTGEPLVTDELLRARKKLMQRGQEKVFVVAGGVLAWQAAGGSVFQEIDEKLTAASLDPAALFAGLGNPRVRFLAWDVRDELALRYHLPGVEVCSAADWPRRAGEILQQNADCTLVLIDGAASDRLDAAKLSAQWLGRVAFLRGGFTAYRDHVANFSAIAATKPGSTKSSVRPMANTGPFEGLTLKRGGCGTCPK